MNEGRKKFSLTFTKFDLEESSDCSHDYVQIRYLKPNCKLIDEKPLKFCGSGSKIPKDILDRFAAKAVEVTFVTDGSVTRPGFMATLTRIENMLMIGDARKRTFQSTVCTIYFFALFSSIRRSNGHEWRVDVLQRYWLQG